MKKIMFNDKYGLTDAVLQGRKTMTRRFIKQLLNVENHDISDWGLKDGGKAMITLYEGGRPTTDIFPMYQPGEVVAVAQPYQTILDTVFGEDQQWKCGYMRDVEESHEKMWEDVKGRTNKMFVKADLMPHQIRITDINVERLQDISDEDCLKEGIIRMDDMINSRMEDVVRYTFENSFVGGFYKTYATPREAFAALIDKPGVGGKGTWERNPYEFTYTFELVK